MTPLNNNSLCDEPLPIMLGASATAVSLQDAAQQYVDFCEDENKSAHFQPGLWYTVRGVRGVLFPCLILIIIVLTSRNMQYMGQGTPVIAKASSGVDLHVYPACDQITCDILNAIYKRSSSSSTVEWTAASGADYLLLITLSESSAGTTIRDFELQIFLANNFCEGAQTIVSGNAVIVASVENATEQDVVLCENVKQITSSEPGVWYNVRKVRGM
jgi:hypothetical protein